MMIEIFGSFREAVILLSPFSTSPNLDSAGEIAVNVGIVVMAATIAVICVCRMNVLTMRHKLIVRLRYVFLFCGAIATGLAPWAFPANPRLGSLILMASLVLYLLLSAAEWRVGAPYYYDQLTEVPPTITNLRKEDEQFCAQALAVGRNPSSLWGRARRSVRVVAHILRGDRRWHVQSGP